MIKETFQWDVYLWFFFLLNSRASSNLFFGILLLRSDIYVHMFFHIDYLFSVMGETFNFKEDSLLVAVSFSQVINYKL
jgi:hypothetical protein